jgi:eukaryotic-like serine/threonine-protein kinase
VETALSNALVSLSRYAVCDEIASGGMATVHVGRQRGAVGFARTVAVKRLFPTYARDPEFVAMFTEEARLAARIRHPNVIATLDVVAENRELFLVMEYVAGESLSTLVQRAEERGVRMPPEVTASIVIGMLEGLQAVHDAVAEDGTPLGIVHRDVSPHNVMVGVDGAARLLDFGIAKATALAQRTRQGLVKGKLGYMAPEQLRGEPVSCSSDLFSVGVVLWELLSGQRLFRASNEGAIIAKILEARIPPVEELAPGIGPVLGEVVALALAKDPQQRPGSAADMARRIERAIVPASHHAVGAWVREIASESLKARAEIVRKVERETGEAESAPISSGAPGAASASAPPSRARMISVKPVLSSGRRRTQGTLTMAAPNAPRRFGWRAAITVGLAAGGVVGAVAFAFANPTPRPSTASRGIATSAQGAAVRARPSLEEPAPPEPPPRAGLPAEPVEPGSTPSDTALPWPPPTPPAIKTKSPCDPPYYEDADGIRRVKRECLW